MLAFGGGEYISGIPFAARPSEYRFEASFQAPSSHVLGFLPLQAAPGNTHFSQDNLDPTGSLFLSITQARDRFRYRGARGQVSLSMVGNPNIEMDLGTESQVHWSLNRNKSEGGWGFGLFSHTWPPLPLSSVYHGGCVWKDPRTSCGSGCSQHCSLWG